MRRIALYSDVHGNTAALDVVLRDIERAGLTERYCLGDLVGLGPEPNEAALLVRSAGDVVIQGNYDRAIAMHLLTPGSDFPSPQEALDGAESYAFTVSEIGRDVADFLHALPVEVRLEHEGARLLLCHGTPSSVSGSVQPGERPAHVVELARGAHADVVCAAHTHVPFHRSIPDPGGTVHWVNPGSVGRPRDGDPRAGWAELVLGERAEVMAAVPMDTACRQVGDTEVWLGVTVHRIAYDVEAVIRDMTARALPHTLAVGLRYGHEEHDTTPAELSETVVELSPGPAHLLPCGHTREACTCMYDDRTVAYECLARLYRGDISEAAAAVRRLRIAMRGCRVNRHVDEAAILAAFEGADLTLRTAAGRADFMEERERLYGLAKPFDPFVNVLSPEETTYLSGSIERHLVAIEDAYTEGSFTVPEVGGVRSPGHIATELSFMAHCLRGAASGDARALERARHFFIRHLGEWAVLFAVVVGQQAREPVMRYAGLALDKHLTCEGTIFRHNLPELLELRATEQAVER